MPMTTAAKPLYLNGGNVAHVKIVAHTSAPAADGSTNRIGSLVACTFTTATGDERTLSADVDIVIPAGVTTASHYSIYNSSDVCLHVIPFNTPRTGLVGGDILRLKATGADACKITIA